MSDSFNSVSRSSNHEVKEVRRAEQGSATTNFVLVVIALILISYGGYNYIIVWYQCSHFKDKMTEIITQAYAMPKLNSPELVRQKILAIGEYDSVPADAVVKIEQQKAGLQARVTFVRDVSILPFNMYKYKYQFDQTAVPPSMFEIK